MVSTTRLLRTSLRTCENLVHRNVVLRPQMLSTSSKLLRPLPAFGWRRTLSSMDQSSSEENQAPSADAAAAAAAADIGDSTSGSDEPLNALSAAEEELVDEDVSETSELAKLDGSTLPYISDYDRLHTLVLEVEALPALTSNDVMAFVHPLMLATSALDTDAGAHLTERLLAKCLLHISDERSDNLDAEFMLPHPNAEMYNLAITAWTGINAQRAQQLLELMEDEYAREAAWLQEYNAKADENNMPRRKLRSPKPDLINYSSVIDAWASSGSKDGPFQAQAMLENLEKKSGVQAWLSGRKDPSHSFAQDVTPDRMCYNTVIKAWARSSHPQAVAKAKALLETLQKLYESTNNIHFAPDYRTYNSVLSTISQRSGRRSDSDARAAEAILQDVHEKFVNAEKLGLIDSDGTPLVRPDIKTYNGVIYAWSNSGVRKAPFRSEAILLSLLGKVQEDIGLPIVEDVVPDIVTFNSVIHTWAKSGLRESGQRAEALLQSLPDARTRDGTPLGVTANTITYNSVMNAWARSRHEHAAERAEQVLHLMLVSDAVAKPNVISFSTAINAWAKSNSRESISRAESLLVLMEKLADDTGDDSLLPNRPCYFSALLACKNHSGSSLQVDGLYAAEKAQQIFDNMVARAPSEVDASHCNILLDAWSKHSHHPADERDEESLPNKVEQSRAILHKMQKKQLPDPKTSSFNFVIAACSSLAASAKRRREAFFTALDTYNQLCESNYCQPDETTYALLFQVFKTHLMRTSREQAKLAEDLFHQCCDDGLLSDHVLRLAAASIPDPSLQRITGISMGLVRVQDLPVEWSCNLGGRKPGPY